MALEEEDQAAFDDEEDDLEDTDDSDMEEEFDDDEAAAAAAAAQPLAADPNSSVPPISTTPNPNPGITNPTPPQNGTLSVPIQSLPAVGSPDPKRQRTEEKNLPPVTPPPIPAAAPAPAPSSASLDDSRRLFQRLWTDDDEIKILKGFLEFTSSRGTTFASHQYDTGPFYEQIKNQLQLDFNKNQLIEKLRRLKKKYRNTATRMASHGREFAFKSPHEKATYEIARKIWSASIKRSRDNSDEDDLNPYANSNSDAAAAAAVSVDRQIARSRRRGRKRALDTIPVAPAPIQVMPALPALMAPPVVPAGTPEGVVKVEVQTAPAPIIKLMPSPSPAPAPAPPPALPSIVEETVKSCMSPIFKELLTSVVSGPGIGGGLGFGLLGLGSPPVLSFGGNLVNLSDARWKQQQIMELEVYLKRVELVRDQIKSTLEELKSSSPLAPAPVPAAES